MQTEELIESILNGNHRDFEQLIKKYQPNVFRVAMGLLHSKEDAEEITQDVFVKVYQSISAYNGKSAFSTWLYSCLLYTSPSPRDRTRYRMPSSA